MSRNSFRQIEAQINEYEDMRAHARMERNAELRAKLDSYPVADDLVHIASGRLCEQLAKKLDEEIYLAICHRDGAPVELGFAMDQVRNRCQLVTRPDGVTIFVIRTPEKPRPSGRGGRGRHRRCRMDCCIYTYRIKCVSENQARLPIPVLPDA